MYNLNVVAVTRVRIEIYFVGIFLEHDGISIISNFIVNKVEKP